MRRSFRTLRLCAIPGVSPRAGMRCPVGALRTPHPAERDRSAASLGSDHQNPSRTARKPLLPRASSASAGPIPRSAKIRPAERDRSGASLGGEQQNPLAHSAKAQSSPELPQRAQDRSRGAPKYAQAERGRSAASLGSDHQKPLAHSAKAPPPQSFLSERRTDPAERSTTASAGPFPRSVRLKKPVAEGFRTGRVAVPAGDFHP
jgi:hypothetical protein